MIISALPPEQQADVAKRVAMMDRTSPDIIKEVEKILESKLANLAGHLKMQQSWMRLLISWIPCVDLMKKGTTWIWLRCRELSR